MLSKNELNKAGQIAKYLFKLKSSLKKISQTHDNILIKKKELQKKFNIKIDYPSRDEEVAIVQTTTSGSEAALKSIISKDQLLTFQELVRRVPVAENVVEYAVDLVRKTRSKAKDSPDFIQNWIDWGAGPRASQYLILGAKGRAILDGRPTPDISDVNALALPVLRHRLITNFNAEAEGVSVDDIILKLLG